VGRIRILVPVEHGLPLQNLERRRRSTGTVIPDVCVSPGLRRTHGEGYVAEPRAPLANPAFGIRETHGHADRAAILGVSLVQA